MSASRTLVSKTELSPEQPAIQDIERLDEKPVAGGAYADVHRAKLHDKFVCLKIIRVYQTSSYENILKVRPIH